MASIPQSLWTCAKKRVGEIVVLLAKAEQCVLLASPRQHVAFPEEFHKWKTDVPAFLLLFGGGSG